MLAIVTATLLKYSQHHYDNLIKTSKDLMPMLVSNRRELRHGAIECFTVICGYFNTYKPMTSTILDTNPSIKLVLSFIENLSNDALNALRFRLQRNSLPSLTDEGNITPGLVCDTAAMNDPDVKFILLASNQVSTPHLATTTATAVEPPPASASTKRKSIDIKGLPLTIENVEPTTTKSNTNDAVSFFYILFIASKRNQW